MRNENVNPVFQGLLESISPSVINSEVAEIERSAKQRSAIRDVLLEDIHETVRGCEFDLTDGMLDKVWECVLLHTADRNLLMSDVVNGDEELDTFLIEFARDGSGFNALKIRGKSQHLFRTWAKMEAEKEEIHVMDCYRTPNSEI